MRFQAAILLLASAPVFAADFQSGQAARAVLGQSSFTARDSGVRATSLVALRDKLYAADSNRHVLTFDLSRLGSARDDRSARSPNGCSVCDPIPLSQTNQSVLPGVATVSEWGKAVAIADTVNHRVLIWRDATAARADRGPDVILGRFAGSSAIGPGTIVNPVSVGLDGKRLFVGDAALHRVLVWNALPITDDQPADAVLGQPDFFSSSVADGPAPDTIAVPAAITSDGNDVFIADAVNRRVLVFSPGDTLLASNAVLNAASLASTPLAPGTLVTIQNSNFADSSASADADSKEPLPRRLAGVEAILDGQALPLLSVSPSEVEAQIPYDLGARAGASLYLRVERAGTASVTTPVALKLVAASPGLYALGGDEPRPGLLLHASSAVKLAGGAPVTEENPARPGEVVTVWATGLGSVWESSSSLSGATGRAFEGPAASVAVPVSAQINGQAAQVVSALLPVGALGVYEIQIVTPSAFGRSAQASLSITQNGLTSNVITFAIRSDQP